MTELLTRIKNLPPNKKELLLRKLSHLGSAAEQPPQQAGAHRIQAFLVAEKLRPGPSQQELRAYLKNKLPEYMIPSEFVILDALPLTPNGKIDRMAIQQMEIPDERLNDRNFVHPRTESEEILAKIWMDLMGVSEMSVHDNFFEVGGDSLISIRIIARANQVGFNLTPQMLFEHPTIAEMASLLEKKSVANSPQESVYGEFTLLPIQQWFLEWEHPEPSHWNLAIFLKTSDDFDENAMEKSLQQLVNYHDALRISVKLIDGRWIGSLAETEEVLFDRFDLSSLSNRARHEAIRLEAAKLHRSLDIEQGPIFRVAYFHFGSDEPGRLLLIAHHMAVDWISLGVLLDDLSRLYQGFLQKSENRIPLPPKTTSIKTWSERLKEYANSPGRIDEIDFWVSGTDQSEPFLPTDHRNAENSVASEQVSTVALPTDLTQQLLNEANQAYQTRVEELLLTALVLTFHDWTHHAELRIGLEGHGRENLFEDLDLSRTVGWFTSYFPLWLKLEHPDDAGTSIKQIKEQLRGVPNRGIGYGILRYLSDRPDVEILKNSPYPQVLFNYLGRAGMQLPEHAPFKLIDNTSIGGERSGKGLRRYLIEINATVQDDRLHLSWTYSQNIYHQKTVDELSTKYLSTLSRIIEHCLDPDAGGFTPSDFPLADLDDREFDQLSDLLDQID
jgi:non-ribosomal peptide synthase protein (TIGR01720 family)